MATIIEFRGIEQRPDAPRLPEARASGEIIIFPGVRRERHAEAVAEEATEAPKPRKRERGKPKRDRIDLPD